MVKYNNKELRLIQVIRTKSEVIFLRLKFTIVLVTAVSIKSRLDCIAKVSLNVEVKLNTHRSLIAYAYYE